MEDALERSRKADLDLVEVAPLAEPPVCRIMDYGKFRYEEAQRLKESRKKTVQITMKEVKFKPKIAKGDFDTKVRHMLEFLDEGHKVKVTLQFRGREMAHPELGTKILDAVIEQLGQIAQLAKPKLVVLTHQLFFGTPPDQLLQEVKNAYPGKVVQGNDLDVFD